jgi:hypothetical protein
MCATIAVQTSRPSKLCDGERDQITPFFSLNYKLRTPSHDVAVKECNSSVAGKKVHFHVKTALLVKDILSSLWPTYRPSTELNGYKGGIFLLARL